ncbi:MAG TPA: hypothetical protein DHV28_13165 [Ignavibacteriales bacterium]|nr:hypothetical protein [Ignavibacteriales bacterium]
MLGKFYQLGANQYHFVLFGFAKSLIFSIVKWNNNCTIIKTLKKITFGEDAVLYFREVHKHHQMSFYKPN